MRVVWLCWLSSATALQVHGGWSYMAARATPAVARLGKPSSNTGCPGPLSRSGPLDEQELLRELAELEATLSYKGWQEDAAESEKYYTLAYLALLVKKMSDMRHKQQRHADVHGVRSDPVLRDLDELKATLSYDGWHEDAAEVEEAYVMCPEHSRGSMDQMRRKQRLHDVRKIMLPQPDKQLDLKLLRELDPLFTEDELKYAFSYRGWQTDAAKVSVQYMKDPYYVLGILVKMQWRQVDKQGGDTDYCAQGLQELQELSRTLSYEGWQEDVVQTSVHCIIKRSRHQRDVSDMMAQMRRKQQLHDTPFWCSVDYHV